MPAVPFVDLVRLHSPIRDDLRTDFDRVVASSAFVLGKELEQFEAEFASYCGVAHCVGVGSGTAALTIMLQAAGHRSARRSHRPGAHVHRERARGQARRRGSRLRRRRLPNRSDRPRGGRGRHRSRHRGRTRRPSVRPSLRDRPAARAHGAPRPAPPRGCGAGPRRHVSRRSHRQPRSRGGVQLLSEQEPRCPRRWGSDLHRRRSPGRPGTVPARPRARRGRRPPAPGYNERLDGLQAAFLRTKLGHLDEWTRARRAIAAEYAEQLGAGVELLGRVADSPCTYHVFPIRVRSRDHLQRELGRQGISTRVHYPLALPDQPALSGIERSSVGGDRERLGRARAVAADLSRDDPW